MGRLTATDHVCCGIPTRREAVRGSDMAPLRLCQEQIFDAGVASLFLVSGPPEEVTKGGNPSSSNGQPPIGNCPCSNCSALRRSGLSGELCGGTRLWNCWPERMRQLRLHLSLCSQLQL